MKNSNHLINEKSPYLQAHAHNPVNWFPWGDEAFAKAKEEDKPVFLSSGYSTCHWCHVMEKESFSDSEVGNLLNDAFVCVKVDREERPDIDALYMAVCQLMNGSGGWPLNVMLTPDGLPFFAGTYFPRDTVGNTPGLMELVPRIKFLWGTSRDSLLKAAEDLTDSLKRNSSLQTGDLPGKKAMDRAYRRLEKNFDPQWGGFYGAPKFPMPSALLFLTSYSQFRDSGKALEMTEFTLKKMGMGGIMDHLGGGFHRYSTDRYWKVPHFEKMLYDQALILSTAAQVYSFSSNSRILKIAEMTASCILDTMASPEGAFYSAMDADSEEGEGRYYLWTVEELRKVVGSDWELFTTLFDVKEDGNFHDESTGTKTGLNILYMTKTVEEAAEAAGISPEKFEEDLAMWRSDLLEERNKRETPFMDEKILTDWNSLAISALLDAGKIMDRPAWIDAACRASDWIEQTMISSDGVLYHRYFQGDTAIEGFLDDYAFYADTLIRKYRITGSESSLKRALDLVDKMVELFYDPLEGGFFFADTGKDLFLRLKDAYDGAAMSGNAVAMKVLLDIASITGRNEYREKALATAKAYAGRIEEIPSSHASMLRVLMDMLQEA